MSHNHEEIKQSQNGRIAVPESKTSKGGNRPGAGRKAIGITRKLSLTLQEKDWMEIDRRCSGGDYSVSEIIRSIIEDYLRDVDQL